MLRRLTVLAVALVLAAPGAAIAQNNNNNNNQNQNEATPTPTPTVQGNPTQPFTPLPPAQPTPVPVAEPDDPGFLDSEISGTETLYVIGGVLLLAFVAIGMFISRDAKRSLPESHRPTSRLREEGPHKHKREAKAKSRARGKAQKAARRKNR